MTAAETYLHLLTNLGSAAPNGCTHPVRAVSESFWGLMTNPPHIGFELTWEVITGLLIAWPVRRLIAKHDERKH